MKSQGKMPLLCGKDRKCMEELPLFLISLLCIIVLGSICEIPKEDKNMRGYSDKKELVSVICNKCKKELHVENGILKEGCFNGNIKFGYFSNKDGKKHSFDL